VGQTLSILSEQFLTRNVPVDTLRALDERSGIDLFDIESAAFSTWHSVGEVVFQWTFEREVRARVSIITVLASDVIGACLALMAESVASLAYPIEA
jgi:hypothetical protein